MAKKWPDKSVFVIQEFPKLVSGLQSLRQMKIYLMNTEEEEKEPTGALSRPAGGEIAPEAETTEGEGTQPQTQDEGAAESGV
jgi:hypothetical protein